MKTIIIAALLAAPLAAHAQDLNYGSIDEDTHVATITTGTEHGLVLGAGYAHATSLADRLLVLRGDVTLGWAEVDVEDFRVRVGAQAPLVVLGRWQLVGGLTSLVRGTNNEQSRMINVGLDSSLLAGYYARRGFVALEGGFDWALATHVEHSDAYRMQAYEGARDGWYRHAGGTFRYGLQAGVSFGKNDIILRAGKLHAIDGQPTMFPFYGTLGYDRRW